MKYGRRPRLSLSLINLDVCRLVIKVLGDDGALSFYDIIKALNQAFEMFHEKQNNCWILFRQHRSTLSKSDLESRISLNTIINFLR